VAALEAAPTIGRDEGERRRRGRRKHSGDGVRGHSGQRAEPAFLPRADDSANALVVRDRGTRRGERETAAGTLAAPRDGPRGRSTAAVTERRANSREGVATGPAQLLPCGVADDAAHGQDQI
jgi:hypothetical protein